MTGFYIPSVQGMPGLGGGAAGAGALDFLRNNPQVIISSFYMQCN